MLYALQPFQLDEAQTQPSDFFFSTILELKVSVDLRSVF